MSKTQETFEERLLPMFLDTARSHRRRRRGFRITGVGVTIVAAAVAFASLSLGAALGSDTVTVSAKQAVEDPTGVEKTLRDSGIDATVIVIPVSPYWQVLDNTWWWLHFDGPTQLSQHDFADIYRQVGDGLTGLSDAEIDRGNGIQHFPDLELPKNLPGHLTLFAAKVADGPNVGSGYDTINELSPTGTFWCDRLDPNDPEAVGATLRRAGYDVIWVVEPTKDSPQGASSEPSSPPANTIVTWAWFRGPHTIDVRLMQDGPQAQRYQDDEGTFSPGETPPWTPPCP